MDLSVLGERGDAIRSSIWLGLFRWIDERFFFPTKREYLTNLFEPYLDKGDSLLDVGCSDGRLAESLAKRAGCNFAGIDVHVQPGARIPVKRYDGLHFPFEDFSFDAAMMVDMLHHAEDPEQVLREAARVSRRYLIVKDHHWESAWDWKVLEVADYIGNAPYGIHSPNNYLRMTEWTAMFARLNLRVADKMEFKHLPIDPCNNFMVKLEKA